MSADALDGFDYAAGSDTEHPITYDEIVLSTSNYADPKASDTKKRSLDDDTAGSKKSKKKKHDKKKEKKDRKKCVEKKVESVRLSNVALENTVGEYLRTKFTDKRFKLSDIEKHDIEEMFQDSAVVNATFDKERVPENFGAFLKMVFPGVTDTSGMNGKPKVIVITSNAMRAMELLRGLKNAADIKVAKLFAKHFKIPEQVSFLKTHQVSVGVGSPNRLLKLMEEIDYMSDVEMIVFDNFKDMKQRTVFDMADCCQDLLSFMKQNTEKIRSGNMRVAVF